MGDVTTLDPGKQTELKRSGFCSHRQVVVDTSVRTVTCSTCGADLDAFTWVADYARQERTLRHWEKEQQRHAKIVADLKDEEKRIKARTRNARRKDADVAVAEEREKWETRLGRAASDLREMRGQMDKVLRMIERPGLDALQSTTTGGE